MADDATEGPAAQRVDGDAPLQRKHPRTWRELLKVAIFTLVFISVLFAVAWLGLRSQVVVYHGAPLPVPRPPPLMGLEVFSIQPTLLGGKPSSERFAAKEIGQEADENISLRATKDIEMVHPITKAGAALKYDAELHEGMDYIALDAEPGLQRVQCGQEAVGLSFSARNSTEKATLQAWLDDVASRPGRVFVSGGQMWNCTDEDGSAPFHYLLNGTASDCERTAADEEEWSVFVCFKAEPRTMGHLFSHLDFTLYKFDGPATERMVPREDQDDEFFQEAEASSPHYASAPAEKMRTMQSRFTAAKTNPCLDLTSDELADKAEITGFVDASLLRMHVDAGASVEYETRVALNYDVEKKKPLNEIGSLILESENKGLDARLTLGCLECYALMHVKFVARLSMRATLTSVRVTRKEFFMQLDEEVRVEVGGALTSNVVVSEILGYTETTLKNETISIPFYLYAGIALTIGFKPALAASAETQLTGNFDARLSLGVYDLRGHVSKHYLETDVSREQYEAGLIASPNIAPEPQEYWYIQLKNTKPYWAVGGSVTLSGFVGVYAGVIASVKIGQEMVSTEFGLSFQIMAGPRVKFLDGSKLEVSGNTLTGTLNLGIDVAMQVSVRDPLLELIGFDLSDKLAEVSGLEEPWRSPFVLLVSLGDYPLSATIEVPEFAYHPTVAGPCVKNGLGNCIRQQHYHCRRGSDNAIMPYVACDTYGAVMPNTEMACDDADCEKYGGEQWAGCNPNVCKERWRGDGVCDLCCNTPECFHDHGDCDDPCARYTTPKTCMDEPTCGFCFNADLTSGLCRTGMTAAPILEQCASDQTWKFLSDVVPIREYNFDTTSPKLFSPATLQWQGGPRFSNIAIHLEAKDSTGEYHDMHTMTYVPPSTLSGSDPIHEFKFRWMTHWMIPLMKAHPDKFSQHYVNIRMTLYPKEEGPESKLAYVHTSTDLSLYVGSDRIYGQDTLRSSRFYHRETAPGCVAKVPGTCKILSENAPIYNCVGLDGIITTDTWKCSGAANPRCHGPSSWCATEGLVKIKNLCFENGLSWDGDDIYLERMDNTDAETPNAACIDNSATCTNGVWPCTFTDIDRTGTPSNWEFSFSSIAKQKMTVYYRKDVFGFDPRVTSSTGNDLYSTIECNDIETDCDDLIITQSVNNVWRLHAQFVTTNRFQHTSKCSPSSTASIGKRRALSTDCTELDYYGYYDFSSRLDIVEDAYSPGSTRGWFPPQWRVTDWSACDVPCGTGNQHRETSCYDVYGDIVDPSECVAFHGEYPIADQTRTCGLPCPSLHTLVANDTVIFNRDARIFFTFEGGPSRGLEMNALLLGEGESVLLNATFVSTDGENVVHVPEGVAVQDAVLRIFSKWNPSDVIQTRVKLKHLETLGVKLVLSTTGTTPSLGPGNMELKLIFSGDFGGVAIGTVDPFTLPEYGKDSLRTYTASFDYFAKNFAPSGSPLYDIKRVIAEVVNTTHPYTGCLKVQVYGSSVYHASTGDVITDVGNGDVVQTLQMGTCAEETTSAALIGCSSREDCVACTSKTPGCMWCNNECKSLNVSSPHVPLSEYKMGQGCYKTLYYRVEGDESILYSACPDIPNIDLDEACISHSTINSTANVTSSSDCRDHGNCTTCNAGMYLLEGMCLPSCPAGYVSVDSNMTCVYLNETGAGDWQPSNDGVSNNSTCNSTATSAADGPPHCHQYQNCSSCDEGLYLLEGMCLPSCPHGHQANNTNMTCSVNNDTSACSTQPPSSGGSDDAKVDQCHQHNNCSSCDEGMYLLDGMCLPGCPTDFEAITNSTTGALSCKSTPHKPQWRSEVKATGSDDCPAGYEVTIANSTIAFLNGSSTEMNLVGMWSVRPGDAGGDGQIRRPTEAERAAVESEACGETGTVIHIRKDGVWVTLMCSTQGVWTRAK